MLFRTHAKVFKRLFLATKIDIFCKFLLTTKTEEMEKKRACIDKRICSSFLAHDGPPKHR
ncbi:hypothetical protein PORCRE_1662 [Porphyromonas crevioricanis JCM 15906]|uniref:Uncharacterized protein n=1 Tax=Porphyromonas crevioricanis JCM 15906 TaxID=1305617 RepID=T1CS50_9PORP|nr:hypothetical protein PORCRE_1662 [Porphyromonas crevioricanis JCM 15906]